MDEKFKMIEELKKVAAENNNYDLRAVAGIK